MRAVVGSLRHLHHVRFSNVYLLDGGRGDRWLVDCGHWSERATLLWELRRAGVRPSELAGVLLTHRHSDHAGNARFLQRRYGVKIHAHRRDADVLAGAAPRARLTRNGGTLMAGVLAEIENLWPARVTCDRVFDDGDTIGSLEVHHTPGHTEGSVFYRHGSTQALLTGDMLLTAKPPLVYRKGMSLAYVSFSSDLALAVESVQAFHRSGVEYEHLLPGHGKPIVGGARRVALEFLGHSSSGTSSVTH
jgi:glyoxylase-like metal-dependent hydrolase (beta-lactamase superfamily II)